jgi:ketosteroid isomerase-like protein
MSQENVELVRAFITAWNAGNMDAIREMYDPDVIMRFAEGWPEPGPFVGRDEVMRRLEQMRETWDADEIELTGDFSHAADRVAVRQVWRAAGHGPEAIITATAVTTFRKGRITAVEFLWDHTEALQAVGLEE